MPDEASVGPIVDALRKAGKFSGQYQMPPESPADPTPIGEGIGNYVKEAVWPDEATKAWNNQLSPDEAKNFALKSAFNTALSALPLGKLSTSLAALHLVPTKWAERTVNQAGTKFVTTADKFKAIDEMGAPVAHVELFQNPNNLKELSVDTIKPWLYQNLRYPEQSALAANTLGPSDMRSLVRQLKKFYPEAETLEGHRVTGARVAKKGIDGSADTTVRLK